MVAAIVEYWTEIFLLPSIKGGVLFYIGFLMTFFGQAIRLVALFTAKANFTHEVAEEKLDTHVLVTNGIYQYSRHPGYFGWFWWAIGTQVLLSNPLCIIGYTIASWRFFHDRIHYEEEYLVQFFGENYVNYRKRTSTLIPFIR